MTFAEMVKNREWEKIFDILDQGTIEKKNYFRWSLDHVRTRGHKRCPSRLIFVDPILKDKLGVLTKEEFEESLKQNGFEEKDIDAKRKWFIFSIFVLCKHF